MIDPFQEYNEGVERARTAYWHLTSPMAEFERAQRKRDKNREYAQSLRTRKKRAKEGRRG